MPIKVKLRPANTTVLPLSPGAAVEVESVALPVVGDEDGFHEVIRRLAAYFAQCVTKPLTFEQLRVSSAGDGIQRLVGHLAATTANRGIINALLALKWHYDAEAAYEYGVGLGTARGMACEITAWRFLAHLSEREAVEYCLYEVGDDDDVDDDDGEEEEEDGDHTARADDPNYSSTTLPAGWTRYRDEEESSGGEASAWRREEAAFRESRPASFRSPLLLGAGRSPDRPRQRRPRRSSRAAAGHSSRQREETSPSIFPYHWFNLEEVDSGGERRRRPGSSATRNELLSSLSRLTLPATASSPPTPTELRQTDEQQGPPEGPLQDDPTLPFRHLNALEIAAISKAKRFLSQHIVQRIITGIWNGDIVFWDSLSVHATKQPRFYRRGGPLTTVTTRFPLRARINEAFSRLRVPKYLKAWEVFFFVVLLLLYFRVMTERRAFDVSAAEAVLHLWFVAFFCDEVSAWLDAGSIFYASDVWNAFDLIMILLGFTFAAVRTVALAHRDADLANRAYDILSLEALFMVPRIFSILSLSPYWGTLIPCLTEMGRDFGKFMVVVVIVYLGFLTTFSLLGRDAFSTAHMTMILTKIFFGGGSVGLDVMADLDPILGPPLMVLFIILSSFLLMGSLTGMLSSSFSRVITQSREEYLYVYSVYVLEASTSQRLTHFVPPFNILAIFLFRPLRLVLPNDDRFRRARILLLKATHFPLVLVICLYEYLRGAASQTTRSFTSATDTSPAAAAAWPDQDMVGSAQRRQFPRFFRKPSLHLTRTVSTASGKPEARDPLADTVDRLAKQVEGLSSQLDEMKALLLDLRGPRTATNTPKDVDRP